MAQIKQQKSDLGLAAQKYQRSVILIIVLAYSSYSSIAAVALAITSPSNLQWEGQRKREAKGCSCHLSRFPKAATGPHRLHLSNQNSVMWLPSVAVQALF